MLAKPSIPRLRHAKPLDFEATWSVLQRQVSRGAGGARGGAGRGSAAERAGGALGAPRNPPLAPTWPRGTGR
jgi:hypothetical protein